MKTKEGIKEKVKNDKPIDDVERFIKTPKQGDTVKVYMTNSNPPKYGVVKRIDIIEKREIAVLDYIKKALELHECDFCFDERKVIFED